jgi:hypothetical protein
VRTDKRGRRIGYNWWRSHVVDIYEALERMWLDQREEVAIGYRTEELEFARDHPRPTFKRVLIQSRFKHLIPEEREPDEQVPAA